MSCVKWRLGPSCSRGGRNRDRLLDIQQIRTALAHGLGTDIASGEGVMRRGVHLGERGDLVIAVDTLVEGAHFPAGTSPQSVGHKALAVNLSDLAAMGAEPRCFTVTLALSSQGSAPESARAWLDGFVGGLRNLAGEFEIVALAVDAVEGPLAATVQAFGMTRNDCLLRRGGARPGDGIYVTGTLGDAALGLELRQAGGGLSGAHARAALRRLEYPVPRVRAGMVACGWVSAAIDISDGLAADLGHVLAASGVGARVDIESLPLSASLRALWPPDRAVRAALSGGDDYELCLVVPPEAEGQVAQVFAGVDTPVTRIGTVEAQPGLRCMDGRGAPVSLDSTGYRHFDG